MLEKMKAAVMYEPGGPEVLKIEEVGFLGPVNDYGSVYNNSS